MKWIRKKEESRKVRSNLPKTTVVIGNTTELPATTANHELEAEILINAQPSGSEEAGNLLRSRRCLHPPL